ncbi:uncharacterized protein [Drosophila virilis]|uniref:uncharacterized protein n=1 Tax=Drosophila virilis TaxID=7244 RepID=UPI0038B29C70
MKWTQLNLNHCEAAQALLTQSIRERNTDVAIICEPYKPIGGSGWVASKCGKAAIWSEQQTTDSWELRQFLTMLEEISEDARNRAPLVIAGDFNAVEWGSKETNARGITLLEEFAALDLGPWPNDGQKLTYCKAATIKQCISRSTGEDGENSSPTQQAPNGRTTA